MEIEHESADLVDGGHPQRRQSGRGATGFGAVLAQAHHLGAGEKRVADDRETVEGHAAVEQIRLHPLGHQRGLADRDVADQCGVRHRARHPGHGVRQFGVQGQPQAVADDALVRGGDARGERNRRRPVEHLALRQVVEVGTRHR